MIKLSFSEARLSRLQDAMTAHVETGGIPGLVYAVYRRGEFHVQAMAGAEKISRNSIFRIASMSKPVSAVAAMILVEECRLRLDDPVDDFLPELANRKVLRSMASHLDDVVPANRAITLRDLLTFTLGLGIVMAVPGTYPVQEPMEDPELGQGIPRPSVTVGPDEWMGKLGQIPLMHQPGESWLYHTGSDVLGVLIARASGLPFESFLHNRIFEPLGMDDTGFWVPESKISRLAKSYWTNFQTGQKELYDDAAGGQWSKAPVFPSGGGGLVSTVDDYLAFAQMLLGYGAYRGQRILSRASVEAMITDQLTAQQRNGSGLRAGFWDTNGWGFGVSVVNKRYDIWATPGQYGWDGGLGTCWKNDPAQELAGIILTQQAFTNPTPPPVIADFWTSTYQAIED